MSTIYEELKKIEDETSKKIEQMELDKENRKMEENKKRREENKSKGKKRILDIIDNPNLELDEPKIWKILYKMGNPLNPIMNDYDKTVVMTERQKMLLEETNRLKMIVDIYAKIETIEEVSEKEISDIEKIQLESLKEKIKLLKTSIDPELDEKGKYISESENETVETEMTLRQALLVTTPETRGYFKTYKKIKEEKMEQEAKYNEQKSSKISLKSIKEALKEKFKIR